MSSTANDLLMYSDQLMNDLWNDVAPGFFNFGRISPDADTDEIPDLKRANEDMADWIVAKLGINKDSHILDLACGTGGYTVRIAQLTGCRFIAVDITEPYIEEECKKRAEEYGVSDQGEFLVGSMMDLSEEIKNKKYTHILCLGAMLYAHDQMDKFLQNVHSCCDEETKVFIWDLVRNVPWEELSEFNEHLKMEFPLLTKENVLDQFKSAQFELTDCEDTTPYVVPGLVVIDKECRKRDPELKILDFYKAERAFRAGTVLYLIYCLKAMKTAD